MENETNVIIDEQPFDEEVSISEETQELADAVEKSLMDEQHAEGVVINAVEYPEKEEEKSIEDILSDVAENSELPIEKERDFTAEDLKRTLSGGNYGMVVEGYEDQNDNNDGINPKFKISDEAVVKLISVMNRVKNKEQFNIFASLPDEVKKMINDNLAKNGLGGFSVQANTARNYMAKSLIDEFIANTSMDRAMNDFNVEMEKLSTEAGKDMSKLIKEYDTDRLKYIDSILEKIPEDDPKRQIVIDTLDAMHDSYKLTKLSEAVKTMKKFKSIEIEKPQQRLFNKFEDKYRDSQYHIYSMSMIWNILNKYNSRDPKENLLFLLAFCKYCDKFDASIPAEHAFMYYTEYNIILMDIYKDKEFEDFAVPFLATINTIIDELVAHQNVNNQK